MEDPAFGCSMLISRIEKKIMFIKMPTLIPIEIIMF